MNIPRYLTYLPENGKVGKEPDLGSVSSNILINFQIVLVGVAGEVSVQKDIYKTVEVLKAKIKQDKKGRTRRQG